MYGAYGRFDFASSPSKEDEEYLFTCIYDYSLFVGTCQCLLLGICGTAMVVHGNFLVPSISTQSPFQMQSPSKNWKFMWLLLKKHCPTPCPALPRQKGEMHVVSWILELDSRISCLLNSLKIVLDSYVSCHCSSNMMSIFFQVLAEKMEELLDFDKYAN